MEIFWYGHACFELKSNTATIITDPYDNSLGLAQPSLHADIVTVSHNNPRHNAVNLVQGNYRVLDSPGEYEIKEVFITGQTLYSPKADNGDAPKDRNVIFVFEIDNLTICHLGDISHVPTQSQVEAIDKVEQIANQSQQLAELVKASVLEAANLLETRLSIKPPSSAQLPKKVQSA